MSENVMPRCKNCGNYNEEFIEGLKKKLLNKIALESNKDLSNLKYGLGLCDHIDSTNILIQYVDVLDRLLDCDKCMSGMKVEDIVSAIKNKLK